MHFTIRVKGVFFWKEYRCIHFRHEFDLGGVAIEPRLKLTLDDGRQVFIPKIAAKRWEIGANYQDFMDAVALESEPLPIAEENPIQ